MTRQLQPDPDLEALIRKLNSAAQDLVEETGAAGGDSGPGEPQPVRAPRETRWRLAAPSEDGEQWLDHLLEQVRSRQGSDLLLVAGAPAMARVRGRLEPVGERELSSSATEMLCAALVPPTRREAVESAGTVDFAFDRPALGRFRANVHRQRGHWAAAVRVFPDRAPDLESLHLPPVLESFCSQEHGLVLVTGPTGCGKSTTLAALARRILERRRVHLITIEDPVEYEHQHGDSLVEHIEIGRDIDSYARALRSALRQDPDVLIVGEMRDPESIAIAITAAETGHLVLSTLHTGDAPQTIHRILDSYPAGQSSLVRVQLSVSLIGVISQQLLPRVDGTGRVPAVEVLMATHAVRNLIRKGKIEMLRSQILLEPTSGSLSLDGSLARLVRAGLVDSDEALARAREPQEFPRLLR